MADKLILETKKEIIFISSKIFSTVQGNLKSKSSDFLACSHSRRKDCQKKKEVLNIDCCSLCLVRYYKKEISSSKNYPVFKQR